MDFSRELYQSLLNGYQVCTYGRYGARLRDAAGNPLSKMYTSRFEKLKAHVLRQTRKGIYIIDLRKVRSLHGNHICKKLYKEIQHAKSIQPAAGKGI